MKHIGLALCLAIGIASLASATTVYEQSPVDLGGFSISNVGPDEFIAADSFELTSAESISALTWWGAYVGDVPSLVEFRWEFLTDFLGSPGISLASDATTLAPTLTALEMNLAGQALLPVYEFHAELGTTVDLAPGNYWFSARDLEHDDWLWLAGNGPDSLSAITFGGLPFWGTTETDLAFRLEATPQTVVPEPSTWVLFLVGAGSLLATHRQSAVSLRA